MSKNLLPCPFCGGEAEPIQELPMQHRAYIICSDHNCWGHMKVEWGTMDDKDKFIKRLIDNWNRRADGWISVTERLPEMTDRYKLISDKVLIAYGVNDKQITFGWLRGSQWVTSERVLFKRQELITHWMPLPEPPKEGHNNAG